jgi:dipeptidyl-peptidase 4
MAGRYTGWLHQASRLQDLHPPSPTIVSIDCTTGRRKERDFISAARPVPEVFLKSTFVAFAMLCASLPVAAQQATNPLTVEAIQGAHKLDTKPPEGLTWSPDGKHLSFLENDELIALDPATGKRSTLIDRAALARLTTKGGSEQDRDHRERYSMASYLWSPDARQILFDTDGHLWVYDLATGKGTLAGESGAASGDDPKFSPDGKTISFLRGGGLAVLKPGAKPVTLVTPPNKNVSYGAIDWVYSEELAARSNYFWSPDSRALAFLAMDETAVPEYPLTDWIPGHSANVMQRYPQAGDPNPAVRVGIVPATGGDPVWVNLPIKAGDDYIPRFGWANASTVWIETLTRDHKHLDFYFADAATGEAHRALALTDDKFFDEKYNVDVEDGHLVLVDWRDGWKQIYLYRYDKVKPATLELERQLTKGEFEVSEITNVDFAHGRIAYASNEGNPLEQQLWQVDFSGHKTALTSTPGFHAGDFAPNGVAFIDRFSTRLTPPTLSLCQAGSCHEFWHTDALKPYHLVAPKPFTAKAADGSTLYGTLLLPEGATNAHSVPLITNPYGGPGSQTVANRWGDGLLFDELLAQHGFAVLHADNRGSAARGRTFAQAAYHNFGPVQFADQSAMIDAALATNPQLDPQRLGWWGWSWGGSFTLYALSHSDRFRAGVSVAPVTAWQNYDSIYTERYMSRPQDFPEGYEKQSEVYAAAHLKGHLLLVHGTGDDNVHVANSIQYIQKLIDANIPYDLQLYPRKTHSISGPTARVHLYTRIVEHFEKNLKPVAK